MNKPMPFDLASPPRLPWRLHAVTVEPPLPSNWDLAAWHIQSATARAGFKRRWWYQRAWDRWRA